MKNKKSKLLLILLAVCLAALIILTVVAAQIHKDGEAPTIPEYSSPQSVESVKESEKASESISSEPSQSQTLTVS